MQDIEKLAKELKAMDKASRKEMLSKLARDPKLTEQVASLMEDPAFVKKLKDLLR